LTCRPPSRRGGDEARFGPGSPGGEPCHARQEDAARAHAEALADPPASATARPRSSRAGESFGEFIRGDLPRWALVRHRMDAAGGGRRGRGRRGCARAAARDDPARLAGLPGRGQPRHRQDRRSCPGGRGMGSGRRRRGLRRAAMGSHGGATPEGQLEVLAPTASPRDRSAARSDRAWRRSSWARSAPAYRLRRPHAFEGADVIVPITASKPHTDFRGEIESGLMKMIAIGLEAARRRHVHRQGYRHVHELIPRSPSSPLQGKHPVRPGLVENGCARLWRIEAVPCAASENASASCW